MLTCQRCIELNPVRAAMVEDPVYLTLARSDATRQTAYRALFRAQLDCATIDDIRLALNQSQPLGNSRFLAKIEKMSGMRPKCVGAGGCGLRRKWRLPAKRVVQALA